MPYKKTYESEQQMFTILMQAYLFPERDWIWGSRGREKV
jgi:hypothetical protein